VADVDFYNRMFGLATSLMNKFGTPATHRKVTKGKPGADGKSVVTNSDTPGLAVQLHDEEMIKMMNLEGDVAYVAKFPVDKVETGHQIIHAGNTMEILSTKAVNPEGNRMMVVFLGTKRA